MLSVEFPVLRRSEKSCFSTEAKLWLRSVLGVPPITLRERRQEAVKFEAFLPLASTPHLFLLSLCHNKCHTAHVGVSIRDTREEAT